MCVVVHINENSVGLSSTTNPKPKGQPSISLPAQANLTQQKAESLRYPALRTRGGRLALLSHRNSPYPPKWLMDTGQHAHMTIITHSGKLTESPVSTITSYYISL